VFPPHLRRMACASWPAPTCRGAELPHLRRHVEYSSTALTAPHDLARAMRDSFGNHYRVVFPEVTATGTLLGRTAGSGRSSVFPRCATL
jgi:hypothetical protein